MPPRVRLLGELLRMRPCDQDLAHLLGVASRDPPPDPPDVLEPAPERLLRHREALLLGADQRVRDVEADEGRGLPVAAPPVPAAGPVLPLGELLHVLLHAGEQRGLGREALGLEGVEHVAKRGDGQDTRRELLVALVGVLDQVEDRVGQALQGRRRGGQLEAAPLLHRVARSADWLGDRPLGEAPVGGEGLGGGRGPHRELVLAGVGAGLAGGADLEAGGAGPRGGGLEEHLRAVVGRHRRPEAARPDELEVGGAGDDVDHERLVGLVLQHDRQREAVPEVEEPGWRGAHHQGQARDDRVLGAPEAVLPRGRHGHHPVAGQAVGQLHPGRGAAARVGAKIGDEGGQRVEVEAHGEGARRLPLGAGLAGRRGLLGRHGRGRWRRRGLRCGRVGHVPRGALHDRRPRQSPVAAAVGGGRAEVKSAFAVGPRGPLRLHLHPGEVRPQQRDAIAELEILRPLAAQRIEHLERIRGFIAREREHGLVHHDQGHLGTRHRPPRGVGDADGDPRLLPGLRRARGGLDGDGERAIRGGHPQGHLSAREGRPPRERGVGAAALILAQVGADEVEPRGDVGDVPLEQAYLEHRGRRAQGDAADLLDRRGAQ